MPPRGDYGSIASDESESDFEDKKPLPETWDWRNYPLTLGAAAIVLSLALCWVLTYVTREGFGEDHSNHDGPYDPSIPLEFAQIVDHNHPRSSGIFAQRYYENLNHWQGPGHPIFLIIGGEGPIDGIAYPFISEILAANFGAYTVELEHRSVSLC